jgi:hypothetical protein
VAEEDKEQGFRWQRWARANSDRKYVIHRYLEQKADRGQISHATAQTYRDLFSRHIRQARGDLQHAEAPEKGNAAVLEALLRRHPELLPDLDQQMRS